MKDLGRSGMSTDDGRIDLPKPVGDEILSVIGGSRDEAFDQLTSLAARLLHVKASLITLVGEERQYFKSAVGVDEPWRSAGGTPLSHSFCRHAVESGTTLLIEDARENPLVADNPAVSELGVISYAGIPIRTPAGDVVGTLCVLDSVPRQWTSEEVRMLEVLADTATDLLADRLHGTPATDALWQVVSRHLDLLTRYDVMVSSGIHARDAGEEPRLLSEIESTRRQMARELEAILQRHSTASESGSVILEAVALYLDASRDKERASAAVAAPRGLADYEQACIAASAAEDAIRRAVVRYPEVRDL